MKHLKYYENIQSNDDIEIRILMAAFAKPLLCAGRFISTKFNLKTRCIKHFKTRSIIWRLIASPKLQKNHLTTMPTQQDLESGFLMI